MSLVRGLCSVELHILHSNYGQIMQTTGLYHGVDEAKELKSATDGFPALKAGLLNTGFCLPKILMLQRPVFHCPVL